MKAISASIVILAGAVVLVASAIADVDGGPRVIIPTVGGFLIFAGLCYWFLNMGMNEPKP